MKNDWLFLFVESITTQVHTFEAHSSQPQFCVPHLVHHICALLARVGTSRKGVLRRSIQAHRGLVSRDPAPFAEYLLRKTLSEKFPHALARRPACQSLEQFATRANAPR